MNQQEFLKDYLFLSTQNEPGIYFFFAESSWGEGLIVDYVGQAANVYRRVQFDSHHRLRDGYVPKYIRYLPLVGADADDLDAAESLFIHLYLPVQNQSHLPVIRFGDLAGWSRRLIACLDPARQADFYRFLTRRALTYADGGRQVVDTIVAELRLSVPEDLQMNIVRECLLEACSR